MNDLREYIYTKKPNDEVTLKINRGKIKREIIVKLGKWNDDFGDGAKNHHLYKEFLIKLLTE